MSQEPRLPSLQTTTEKVDSPPPPAYFLSLTVENIRCFGPKQTLDLSNKEGHPAPWTIILGDNGFGKTTLLQCLAALQPVQARNREVEMPRHLMPYYLSSPSGRQYIDDKLARAFPSLLTCSIAFGNKLTGILSLSLPLSWWMKLICTCTLASSAS